MFRAITGFVSAALLAQAGMAEPLIYRNGTLLISEAAVVNEESVAYYKNVVLAANGAGDFELVEAEQRPLAGVEEIAVSVNAAQETVSVSVDGYKSVPCVELEPPAVSRDGHEVTIVLAETVMGAAESCIAMIDPFTTEVELDVSDWDAGAYTVTVNNSEPASFELNSSTGPAAQ